MKKKKEIKPLQFENKTSSVAVNPLNPDKRFQYCALTLILLISFLAYLPVFHNGFVWDDGPYIQNDPLITSFNLKEIFSQYVMSNYHPLTILTLAIEYHLFGLNETGYHAVNLLLHLMNVILVFYTVFLLSEKVEVGLIAALLFGIHPLHVESVAWAAELKDLLYTFFFLASYIFYLKYLKDEQKKYYLFALILFLAALLSKAMAASLPVVMLLTDYFKGRKINLKIVLEKVPFFLLALILGVVAVHAQKTSNAIQDMAFFTFSQQIVFASYGFITYLFKLVLPLHLCVYYPYSLVVGNNTNIPIQFYGYLLLILGLAATVLYSLRFSKKIFFGIGFFAITVFLVLQLLPVGGAIMADRYSYIPSIGIFYLVGEGLYVLWTKKIKYLAIFILVVFTIFFALNTYVRCGVWKNGIIFWTNVISQYQNIPLAYYNRGVVFMNDKRNKEALNDFNKAIELKPAYENAYNNRGTIFMNENRIEEALKEFNKVIELKQDNVSAYYNRGTLYMNQTKYVEALSDFNKATKLKPDYDQPYNQRGIILAQQGKNEEAHSNFKKAIELNHDFAEAYYNRGTLFYKEKKYDEAISNNSKAINIKPNYADAYYSRGLAEYYSGKKQEACQDVKKANSLGNQQAANALSQICLE